MLHNLENLITFKELLYKPNFSSIENWSKDIILISYIFEIFLFIENKIIYLNYFSLKVRNFKYKKSLNFKSKKSRYSRKKLTKNNKARKEKIYKL